jgi:hypothetical protein
VHDTIDDVYISPDERVAILKSKTRADILDATTGQYLFRCPFTNFLSIAFSWDATFVAFLGRGGVVQMWGADTRRHKSIVIDADVFHIALSPDGSQLASLSPYHIKLWDLKSEGWLAHLESDQPLWVQAPISFSTNAISFSVSDLKNSDNVQSWRISPNHNIYLTENPIKNSDGTRSWLTFHPSTYFATQMWQHIYRNYTGNPINNRHGAKLPMVFVPTTEERSNQDASAPCQSYRYDTDDEWILAQDRRRILWIPPDERPRKVWNIIKCEKVMVIQTESGKVYYVNFSQF